MNALSIASTQIRQIDGLYSLNDLHKAAGNEAKHRPAQFLRLDSTQALVNEINQCADVRSALKVVNGGDGRGTFVCKELVYTYGMWISAAFMLQVIRVFDAQQHPAALPAPSTISQEQIGIIYQTLCDKYPNGDERHAAWSWFNKCFGLNSYKNLPSSRFDEAITWLGGVSAPAFPAPTEPEPQPFKLASNARYFMSTDDDGAMTIRTLKPSDFIANMSTLGKRMNDLTFSASDDSLIDIVAACKKVLANRIESAEKRLGTLKRLTA